MPPPGSYDQKSEFLINRARKTGYSFSHDKRETFSREMDIMNPGPGKYDRVYNNYSHLSYSMRSKYEDPLEKHKNVVSLLFSISVQDSITALLLSTRQEITSTLNTEALFVEKLARHQDLKKIIIFHQVLANTPIDYRSTEQAYTSIQKFPQIM